MGKQLCFLCSKGMGWREIKSSPEDLEMRKMEIPQNMTENDRVCLDCYVKLEEPHQQQEQERKQELSQEKIVEFKARYDEINDRSEEYKRHWDKGGVIQFKNERIAILQRKFGQQVQFIVAYDDLVKEGYRLMAIDEGKEASGGGRAGGANAYFYFQKVKSDS